MRKPCRLDAVAGRAEPCPEGSCPFWEPGGAVLEGRCAFERLDLAGRPALVSELLLMRAQLAAAEGEEEDRVRRAYQLLLNESSEE